MSLLMVQRFSKFTGNACRRGFTLIEAAIVTAVVGIGVLAMLQLLAAGSMANAESTQLTTAMGLASNIQEMSLSVPYKTVFADLNNKSYSPPVDARGNPQNDLGTSWRQQVSVKYVDPNRLTFDLPDTSVVPTARITVTVSQNNQMIHTTNWIVAASEWPIP